MYAYMYVCANCICMYIYACMHHVRMYVLCMHVCSSVRVYTASMVRAVGPVLGRTLKNAAGVEARAKVLKSLHNWI